MFGLVPSTHTFLKVFGLFLMILCIVDDSILKVFTVLCCGMFSTSLRPKMLFFIPNHVTDLWPVYLINLMFPFSRRLLPTPLPSHLNWANVFFLISTVWHIFMFYWSKIWVYEICKSLFSVYLYFTQCPTFFRSNEGAEHAVVFMHSVYLCFSLTSLPHDNSCCSHGSTFSYAADQISL